MKIIDGINQWTSARNEIYSPRKGQYQITVTCQRDPLFQNPYNFRFCKTYDGVNWISIYPFNNGLELADNETLTYTYPLTDSAIIGIMVFFRTAEIENQSGTPTNKKVTLKLDSPPKTPANLYASVNSSTTTLTWPAISPQDAGFVGYNIWRVPSGWDPGIKLNDNPITTTSYQIPLPTNPSRTTTDDVYVSSVDNTGNNSGKSPFVSVKFFGMPLELVNGEFPTIPTLYNNYPNPFNPETNITFFLPKTEKTNLSVFDPTGRKIAELVNGDLSDGFHSFTFNGNGISSGTYFYILKVNGKSLVKSFSLVK